MNIAPFESQKSITIADTAAELCSLCAGVHTNQSKIFNSKIRRCLSWKKIQGNIALIEKSEIYFYRGYCSGRRPEAFTNLIEKLGTENLLSFFLFYL